MLTKLTEHFWDTAEKLEDVRDMITDGLLRNPPLTDKEFPKLYKITIEIEECENPLTTLS